MCTYVHTYMHLHTCIHTCTEEVPLRLNLIIITPGAPHCFNYSHYSQHLAHFLSCWQYLGSSSCSLTFTLIATVLPCKGILNSTVKHKSSSGQLLFPSIQIPSLSFSWALQSTFRLAPLLELFQNVWLWFDFSLPLIPQHLCCFCYWLPRQFPSVHRKMTYLVQANSLWLWSWIPCGF